MSVKSSNSFLRKCIILFVIIFSINSKVKAQCANAAPFFASGTHGTNGFFIYPDYFFSASGSVITISWTSLDNPNRFTLYDPLGNLVATSGWAGFVSWIGPWGPSLNTLTNGSFTVAVPCSMSTGCWRMVIETVVNTAEPPGLTDDYSFSVSTSGPTYTLPTVSIAPTTTLVCTGSTATLTASGASTYTWSTTQTSNPISISPTVATTYSVTGTDINGCIGTASVAINVAPSATISVNSATICSGQIGTLTSVVTLAGGNYLWSVGGSTLSSLSDNPTSTTVYTLNYSSPSICAATSTGTLFVNPSPTVTVNSTSICNGQTGTLTSVALPSGGTYSWSPTGVSTSSLTNNPSSTTNYSLTYTAISGCSTTAVGSITVNAIPSASAGLSQTLTCITTSLSLNGSGGGTYSWSGPGILSGGATATPTVNLPGTYSVLVTASGCTNTSTVAVFQNTLAPTGVTATASATITCNTPTLTLLGSPGGSGLTYNWSGPSIVGSSTNQNCTVNSGGTYSLLVTSAVNGCTNTATVFAPTNTTVPTLSVSATQTITCSTLTVALSSTVSPSIGIVYNWSGAGIVSGAATSNAIVNAGGIYTLSVNGVNGCIATATTLVVQNPSTIAATATNNGTLTCITPTLNLTGTGGGTYNWIGSGIISGSNTSTPLINAAGIYTLIVTDANGCIATSTCIVTQNIVVPTLFASPNVTIQLGEQTTLNASGTATTFTWSPIENLSCINCDSPIASPVVTTQYCVSTATGVCTNTACVTVFVEVVCNGNSSFTNLPNAFTPNDDGINDEYCLKGWSDCVSEFYIAIFDRWGEKVYDTYDPIFCWDGTYQGKKLNSAVFVYYVKAKTLTNETISKKGNINLIR